MNVVPLPRAGPYQDDGEQTPPKWFELPEDLAKVFRLGLMRLATENLPRVVLQVVEDAQHQAALALTQSQAYALSVELADAAVLAWPQVDAGGEAEHHEEAS